MVAYRTVVADPPWPYKGRGPLGWGRPTADGKSRTNRAGRAYRQTGSAERYGAMSLDALAAIEVPTESNAHLYLWTTNSFVVSAHELARAWGFAPKTLLTWVKTHPGDVGRVSGKAGYYFRGATEHCLFCVRGSLKLQTTEGLPTAYLWPRLPHSVKPDAFYDLVEQASPGPYLELFSRRARLGWDAWGDQAVQTAELGSAA